MVELELASQEELLHEVTLVNKMFLIMDGTQPSMIFMLFKELLTLVHGLNEAKLIHSNTYTNLD
jgi:hypothetical protein